MRNTTKKTATAAKQAAPAARRTTGAARKAAVAARDTAKRTTTAKAPAKKTTAADIRAAQERVEQEKAAKKAAPRRGAAKSLPVFEDLMSLDPERVARATKRTPAKKAAATKAAPAKRTPAKKAAATKAAPSKRTPAKKAAAPAPAASKALHPADDWTRIMNRESLSMAEVARRMDVRFGSLHRVIKGRNTPTANLTVRFAKATGSSPKVLWQVVSDFELAEALAEQG